MDTDSFRYEEHFSTFESSEYLNIDDESQSPEELGGNNCWEWEVERELNGDVALIPMSSEVGMSYLSNSPPIKEDLHKILSDWHHLMNIEIPDIDDLTTNMALSPDEENTIYIADTAPNVLPPSVIVPSSSSSALHVGFCTDTEQNKDFKLNRPSGKKIDMSAQCYIVEEDEESSPVKTELSDEESEDDDDDKDHDKCSESVQVKTEEIIDVENLTADPKLESIWDDNLAPTFPIESDGNIQNDAESDFIDVDTISDHGTPILQAGDLNSLLEQFEATETTQYFEPALELPNDEELFEFKPPTPPVVPITAPPSAPPPVENNLPKEDESDKNKQILNALPQELIMRIKASSKRKMIPVIDPIPAKRRGGVKKPVIEVPQPPQEKVEKCTNPESIQLDHDYCSLVTPYPKHPKKDSGFESAEEDEQRNILKNQPTVKRADGKLMVSLLKVNTIRSSSNPGGNDNKKKRKLNLEEYKKRRVGVVTSCDNSQNNSPSNSGRNSPAVIEDEKERLLKHQKKLMLMAEEVLKTPAKSAASKTTPSEESIPQSTTSITDFTPPPPPRVPPNNVEVKVLVSIGVNTEEELPPTNNVPITELEAIKPLLKNSAAKISPNSLITSVLENIQNKKKTFKAKTSTQNKIKEKKPTQQHGEDKTIVYLDKNRPPVNTVSVEVQTDLIFEITRQRDKRRRNSSNSSGGKLIKVRSSSNESHFSYTSHSSSSSKSRSRSRSPSPRNSHKKKSDPEVERLRQVEERRIVYVGGISSTMTKEALRKRFRQYGPIINVSVHFREYGDNYGFVTFAYNIDAYKAVEDGNLDTTLPQYDLSFGGRRLFCRTNYADLDNVQDELCYGNGQAEDSFDNLLREAKAKLRKRKSCT